MSIDILIDGGVVADDQLGPRDDGKCPKCGSETEHGFGLCGGGYGPYSFCADDACDWFFKTQEVE